jgi:hypothetical protein
LVTPRGLQKKGAPTLAANCCTPNSVGEEYATQQDPYRPEGGRSIDVRRLSEELLRQSRKGSGADLTPEEVDVALAALRSMAGIAVQKNLDRRNRPLQVELLDDQGWSVEMLAILVDEPVARAAFAAAVKQRPERRIMLRHGSKIVADSGANRS